MIDSLLSFWRRGALAERAGYVVGVIRAPTADGIQHS
jgi:hypothetical protein